VGCRANGLCLNVERILRVTLRGGVNPGLFAKLNYGTFGQYSKELEEVLTRPLGIGKDAACGLSQIG
jgi:hypothetical protein